MGQAVRRLAAAALSLMAVLAASCGSSGPPPPASIAGRVIDKGAQDDTAKGAAFTLTITSGDDYFSPTYIKAAPGARVTVEIDNTGSIAHTFTIDEQNIDRSFGKAGDRATVTVVAPGPGRTLVFYCKYHRDAGMQGAIFTAP